MNTAKLAGVAIASLYFFHAAFTPTDWHFIDAVDLIFHEAGHTIFIFFGEFIHVLMGSGFQVLLPLFLVGYFVSSRQLLSAAVTLMWVGQNLVNVSVYAGDAIVMQLPLLGGDSSGHDWHYLLNTLGILKYTAIVSSSIYYAGVFVIIGAIVWSIYLALPRTGKRSIDDLTP